LEEFSSRGIALRAVSSLPDMKNIFLEKQILPFAQDDRASFVERVVLIKR
jgi:hypothetical protein